MFEKTLLDTRLKMLYLIKPTPDLCPKLGKLGENIVAFVVVYLLPPPL
jgi:hypothetical protein